MCVEHMVATGVDVHRMEVTASVRIWRRREETEVCTRTLSALFTGLMTIIARFREPGVSGVAMETTSKFREWIHNGFREAGIKVSDLDGRHVRLITGWKIDDSDSRWPACVRQSDPGLPSLIHEKIWRDLQKLTRYR